MPKGWGSPSTSIAIRDYLVEKGKASLYETYKHLKEKFEQENYVPPTYTSIQGIFSALKKMGLIKHLGYETSSRGFPKAIYSVDESRLNDERWQNPLSACYNPKKFRERLTKEEVSTQFRKGYERWKEEKRTKNP